MTVLIVVHVAVLFTVVQCCAGSCSAVLCLGQLVSQRAAVEYANDIIICLLEHHKPSPNAAAYQGPDIHHSKSRDWHLPVVPLDYAVAHVLAAKLAICLVCCLAVGVFVLPAAVGTSEQLLIGLSNAFMTCVELWTKNTGCEVWTTTRSAYKVFLHELQPLWSARQLGISDDSGVLLAAVAAYVISWWSLVACHGFSWSVLDVATDLSIILLLHQRASCDDQGAYARSVVWCGLVVACFTRGQAKAAVQAVLPVFLAMPSFDMQYTAKCGLFISVLLMWACVTGLLYLIFGVCRVFQAAFGPLIHLAPLAQWHTAAVQCSWPKFQHAGVSLVAYVPLLAERMYQLTKQAAPYLLSGLKFMLAVVGAKELAVEIYWEWQHLKCGTVKRCKQLCRVHKSTAKRPAASQKLLKSTAATLVAPCSSNESGPLRRQRSKHQQQQKEPEIAELPLCSNSSESGSAVDNVPVAYPSHSSADLPSTTSSMQSAASSDAVNDGCVPDTADSAKLSDQLLLVPNSSKQPTDSSKAQGYATLKIKADKHVAAPHGPAEARSPSPLAASRVSKSLHHTDGHCQVMVGGRRIRKQERKGLLPDAATAQALKTASSKRKQCSNSNATANEFTAADSSESTAAAEHEQAVASADTPGASDRAQHRTDTATEAAAEPSAAASSVVITAAAELAVEVPAATPKPPAVIKVLNSTIKQTLHHRAAAAALYHHYVPPATSRQRRRVTSRSSRLTPGTASSKAAVTGALLQPAVESSISSLSQLPASTDVQTLHPMRAAPTTAAVGPPDAAAHPALVTPATAAASHPALWDAAKPARCSSVSSKTLQKHYSSFTAVLAGGPSTCDTSPSAAAAPVFGNNSSRSSKPQVRRLPSWLQPALPVGATVGVVPGHSQQPQLVLVSCSSSSSSRSCTPPLTPQVSEPYRPLQVSKTAATNLSPASSLIPSSTAAAAAAAEAQAGLFDEALNGLAASSAWAGQWAAAAAATEVQDSEGPVVVASQGCGWPACSTGAAGPSQWDAAWSALAAAAAAQLEQESLQATSRCGSGSCASYQGGHQLDGVDYAYGVDV